jgi:hypothetical protein
MKKPNVIFGTILIVMSLVIVSCAPVVHVTSWKNKEDPSKVSKIVVMALFGKLEYTKPVEQYVAAYFNSRGLKAIEALDFLNPTRKYEEAEIKAKLDSLGADGILVFTYKGTDLTKNYLPSSYYGYWGSPWGYGYPFWYGWGGGLTSGGYWTTTKTVNLKASLYRTEAERSKGALWTADIAVTDPGYIDQAATKVAEKIFTDWQANQLLK